MASLDLPGQVDVSPHPMPISAVLLAQMATTGVTYEILELGWVGGEPVPEKFWNHHGTTLHFLSLWHQFLILKLYGSVLSSFQS